MSISIFAKNPSRAKSDNHLQRVSSIIRGNQIATHIQAKLNPKEGFENDVCIYVKPHVKPHDDFEFSGHPYLDIIDGWMLIPLLKKHPDVSVITCSYVDFEYIAGQVSNKVYLIPQHHANFERAKRTRNETTIIGCIGAAAAFNFLPIDLKKELKKRNIKLVTYSNFHKRADIVNFYQNIDIQIVWRPYMRVKKIRMSNPLKLINAASFGVPSIALKEPAFDELDGCYFPVLNFPGFLDTLDTILRTPKMYDQYSQKCVEKAEKYHIDQIAKLYSGLL